MDYAIICDQLTRQFGDTTAVDRLDLRVRKGEVFGFLGPNGAGKTTTLRMLNGVLGASDGQANVLGYDIAAQPAEIRQRTGVLTETPSVYESLTARQNLHFFGELYGVATDILSKRANSLLDEFGLAERADDRVGEYSKGMRQRLALARTLLHQPALLFFDEPTSGLDPAAARMVNDLIQTLSRSAGRTVFLCTHNLAEAQRLCDRIGIIDHGVLKAMGSPSQLAHDIWQTVKIDINLRVKPTPAVREAIQRVCESCDEQGDGHLVVELKDENLTPDVVAAIVSAGGRIYEVTPVERDLEDIYFHLQGDPATISEGAA